MRKALSMVIDRDVLTSKLTQAGEKPMYGLMPNGTKGVQQPFTPEWASWPMAKRVAAAKDLLKQAGYSDAKPLSFTLTYNTNDLHRRSRCSPHRSGARSSASTRSSRTSNSGADEAAA